MKRHGIGDFRRNPHFPVNTLALMRGAVAARRLGVFETYVNEIYDCMWVKALKMDDPEVFRNALTEAGFDADALLAAIQEPDVKAELAANTDSAVQRGAFGSPTFFVDDQMWFGKDRLGEVEDAILASRGR